MQQDNGGLKEYEKNTYKGMKTKKLTKLEFKAVKFACSTIMADGGDSFQAFDKEKNKMINALNRAEIKLWKLEQKNKNNDVSN